ncbi:MAG: AI-2E family transporter [Hyphomicrobiales bacterium]
MAREIETISGGGDGSGHSLLERCVIGTVVVAALYFGRELFVPIAIAILLAFVLSPIVEALRRWRLPSAVAVTVTVAIAFLLLFGIGAVVTKQASELGQSLPQYENALRDKVRAIGHLTGGSGSAIEKAGETLRDLQKELETTQAGQQGTTLTVPNDRPIQVEIHTPPPTPLDQISRIIAVALTPLATIGVVVVLVIFFLLNRSDVRDRAIRLLGTHDLKRTTVALDEAGQRLSSYFLTLVAINTGFGLAIGAGLWLIGVPNAALWAILSGVLRFVPMVGVFIAAAIPLALAAAIDPGWTPVILVGVLFLAAEGVTNLVVEPLLQASSTGLSAIAILVAAIFWTLLWGPLGLLLAVPLTAVVTVFGQHLEGLNFVHVLLSDTPALTPAQNFYQRMLAADPYEALEQAERISAETSLESYLETVVLPGLELAQSDALLQKLNRQTLLQIRDSAFTVLEALFETNGREKASPSAQALDVACIPGQSPLDEVGAYALEGLLRAKGLDARTLSVLELATIVEQPRQAALFLFNVEERVPQVVYLARRLKRVQHDAPVTLCAHPPADLSSEQLAPLKALGLAAAGGLHDTVASLAAAAAVQERTTTTTPSAA